MPADVSDRAQVTAAIESTVEAFGSLDGVVVNAGVGRGSDVETLSDEQYRTMMDVNVDGAFYTARESLPISGTRPGRWCSSGASPGSTPTAQPRLRRDEVVGPRVRVEPPGRSVTTTSA